MLLATAVTGYTKNRLIYGNVPASPLDVTKDVGEASIYRLKCII